MNLLNSLKDKKKHKLKDIKKILIGGLFKAHYLYMATMLTAYKWRGKRAFFRGPSLMRLSTLLEHEDRVGHECQSG